MVEGHPGTKDAEPHVVIILSNLWQIMTRYGESEVKLNAERPEDIHPPTRITACARVPRRPSLPPLFKSFLHAHQSKGISVRSETATGQFPRPFCDRPTRWQSQAQHARKREREEAIIPSLPVSRLQCYSFTDLEREKGREGEHLGREHSCAPTTHLAHSELRLFMAASLHLLLPLPCLLFFSFDASLKRFLLPFACSLPRFAPPRRRMAPPGLAALLLPVFPLA
jgi:hypothetical protein